ncbi:MAG TPA: NADH-quinone oxidoreductase subunit L [Planctomycetota bacterium]|nr:NADH-quinone oxidoreductase subunit L [Planctomycetota bacterium]
MTGFLAWLTLIAPLGAAVVLTLLPGLRRSSMGPLLAVASVLLCAATSLIFWMGGTHTEVESTWTWMDFATSGGRGIELGVLVDPLSKMMLLVVGWVGSAIFIFALGYMKGDPSIGRFFAKFALFVFSMLGIVLSTNFLMIFVFWELVGASSYLLIGYYYDKPSAVEAGKKAFLVNRVADFGFLLGILMIWRMTGSFHFGEIEKAVREGHVSGSPGLLALASVLIFVGAMGKSAQIPFHVWLPDAMEGPTPVSALMHAATMVAAGVYMVIRVFFCFEPLGAVSWGWAPGFVAWTGGLTAVLAATIALVQRDIKKVLAYSTLSQLGYMVMALGAGAYSIAMFHLTTHAFFKGLLFLCSGSVILGCHHEQDMFQMGGLRKRMPVTFWTFTAGMLALTGICPFAGFWSKDLILDALHAKDLHFLQLAATVTAGLTALYMSRAWILTFLGEYRGHAHPHESPKVMTLPLVFLAVMSLLIGVAGYAHWLFPVQGYLEHWTIQELHVDPSIAIVSTAIVLVGYAISWSIYKRPKLDRAEALKARFPALYDLLWNKYYIDDFYLWLVRTVQQGIARVCRAFEENVIVKGLVGVPVAFTAWVADKSRRLQAGRLNFYAYVFVGGVTVLFLFLLAMGAR